MADVDDTWHRQDGSRTSRYGKGKRWQARWRDPAGRQRKASFNRKLDAERHLAKITEAMGRGRYIDPAAGRVLLRVYAERWFAGQGTDPATRARVRSFLDNHILRGLGDTELGKITPSVVRAWRAGLRGVSGRRLAANTVSAVWRTLAAVLTAAVDDELIAKNPCQARSVRQPPKPRPRVEPWPAERVQAVAAAVGEWQAMIVLGAGEALRQGELFGLAAGDVDFLRRVIHVRQQVKVVAGPAVFWYPKGGKTRDVPLAETVALALAAHMAAHPPVPVTLPWGEGGQPRTLPLVFTRPGGLVVRREWFNRRVWRPALAQCKITPAGEDRTGMHALRHYAASSWLAGGTQINEVAAYLGHTDPGFTLRTYIHLMPSAADRMRTAADAALGWCAPNVPPKAAGS